MQASPIQDPAASSPKRAWQIPTHLSTPDLIFTFAFIRLTGRQLLVLMAGWSLLVQIFRATSVLSASGMAGNLLRLLLCALLGVLSLLVAYLPIAGRPLESWGLVLLRYHLSPHVWVWRRTRWHSVSPPWPLFDAGDASSAQSAVKEGAS